MRVEARRDEHELRLEPLQRRTRRRGRTRAGTRRRRSRRTSARSRSCRAARPARRCRDRTATGAARRTGRCRRPRTIACVPLPWWTSKSTIATRSSPSSRCAARAAMATLLKMQKPIARPGIAWCPGGRTSAKLPRSAASTVVPAASSAASYVVSVADRVAVEPLRAPDVRDPADVLRGVHEQELVLGGAPALAPDHLMLEEHGESLRPLRVVAGRMQARERRMRQDVDRTISASDSMSPFARPTR